MLATLYPDRITLRHPDTRSVHTRWTHKMEARYARENRQLSQAQENSRRNLTKTKTSWKLSQQTKRKISNSYSLLNHLSTPRTIWAKSKKPIYNFRTSFVTLTLPAPQRHSDKEIKSRCLNNFLTSIRQKFNLKNYVWKAELQENQSIHFHIVWDIYIHHSAVRYYWNQSLELLGYVSDYQEKYQNLSLQDYAKIRNQTPLQSIPAYRKGRDTNWLSPPTEQVIAVKNSAQLASYLRKYVIKDPTETSETHQERVRDFGRAWGRSESLSAIQFSKYYVADNLLEFIGTLGKLSTNLHRVVYDYSIVYYVNFRTATSKFLKWLNLKMTELGITYNYQPSGTA